MCKLADEKKDMNILWFMDLGVLYSMNFEAHEVELNSMSYSVNIYNNTTTPPPPSVGPTFAGSGEIQM